MRFNRTPQRYGHTPEPETPYQKAGQLWDDRIGSARVQAKNWRLAFFGSLVLVSILAGGSVWQSAQSRIESYVVEVDRLGEARAVGPAQQDYQPGDTVVAGQLRRFITNVRSLSTDPVIVRQRWLEAYDLASGRGDAFLDAHARANDPFTQIGARSVSVQVTSVVRASPTSFQVKWEERSFERGSLAKTERWTAILTLVRQKPKTRAELERNPLGLFVDAIDWAQEAETRPTTSQAESVAPAMLSPPTVEPAQGDLQP
ncbi:conjugal transfer protein TrbF [Caulobacter radicis]|uniref:conjugal transfer protein TrbF n=1 Tax=Caulobacter radicis TaxID=2172650 RepID=UPI000D575774|nr:conjugal transfer protein TrbF [Caulobacter radicis]PVM84441.1 conjugal transfer protein TrbF [Caulobacter radicis]